MKVNIRRRCRRTRARERSARASRDERDRGCSTCGPLLDQVLRLPVLRRPNGDAISLDEDAVALTGASSSTGRSAPSSRRHRYIIRSSRWRGSAWRPDRRRRQPSQNAKQVVPAPASPPPRWRSRSPARRRGAKRDLNGNRSLSIADCVLLVDVVAGPPDPLGLCGGSRASQCGDLDANGALEVADVVLCLNAVAGNETLVPLCVGAGDCAGSGHSPVVLDATAVMLNAAARLHRRDAVRLRRARRTIGRERRNGIEGDNNADGFRLVSRARRRYADPRRVPRLCPDDIAHRKRSSGTRPRASNATPSPSSSSRCRRSTAPSSERRLIRPSAATTRCHGTRPSSIRQPSARPTWRWWPGMPATRATCP